MKKEEIEQQIDEWITEMEQGNTDKRTGRTIAHSTVALKVRGFQVALCLIYKIVIQWPNCKEDEILN